MRAATHRRDEPAFDQAAHWVARLEAPDCSRAERDAFEHWLAEDPGHVRAWVQAETLHQQMGQLANDPWVRAGTARSARPRRARWLPAVAIAASLCLAVGLVWAWVTDRQPTPQHYANATHLPQQRTLADGSRVTLDAGAAMTTRFGLRQRHITLDRGRIQLQVAPSRRPLRVQAGNSTIEDIGTTFQVERWQDNRIDVALLDGAVEVRSDGTQGGHLMLSQPGQQLQVQASGQITPGPTLPQGTADAWLDGRLVFDATPLQTVVERMNRYHATPMVIADPAIAALAVSGTFRAEDRAGLLAALEQGWSITGQQRADGALELRRRH
ncbi:FecR domain-containing protein [Stenotrophomonas sp. Marseille-Q5258]|uniref:FecR family protein n=1 Tax=Stenotrophomonas sp. Marseille-Q5258 TaxID=2972779 RepID=UPI0021C74029|nr:FecR domain-containing protein [Stenotrophomonas sp. Marseille-Q5258]